MSSCECKPDRAQPSKDGATHIVMDPLELLERLSALVPAPRAHLVRYSGILAPAAKWRALVVPAPAIDSASIIDAVCTTEAPAFAAASGAVSMADPASLQSPPNRHGRNYTWSELMKRVWDHKYSPL